MPYLSYPTTESNKNYDYRFKLNQFVIEMPLRFDISHRFDENCHGIHFD